MKVFELWFSVEEKETAWEQLPYLYRTLLIRSFFVQPTLALLFAGQARHPQSFFENGQVHKRTGVW
jgi:hypothetical protein